MLHTVVTLVTASLLALVTLLAVISGTLLIITVTIMGQCQWIKRQVYSPNRLSLKSAFG